MTNGIGAVVVSVDYRLAPESPWPAAAEDVYAVADWATQQAAALGADPGRLLVVGDSAGGQLGRGDHPDGPRPRLARNCGPGADISSDRPGLRHAVLPTLRCGLLQHRCAMAWYWDQYVPALADRVHPYASPLRARLTDLPPRCGGRRRV